jgi:hypothetical protein
VYILAILFNSCTTGEQPVTTNSLQETYTSQIGIREATDNNDGIEVEQYLASCKLKKGFSWCAAFVNWCFNKSGINTGIKSPACSPSWFADSSKVVYRKEWTKMDYKSKPGHVFGLYFPSKKRIAHVGFIDYEDKNNFYTVEGNIKNGVYRNIRPKKSIYIISSYQ